MGTKPNYAAVQALVADAEPVATVQRFRGDPAPGEPRNGVYPGQWRPNSLGLPEDCPVKPLGIDGETCWLLDPIGQLVAYTDPFGKGKTALLFKGRPDFLKWAWPQYSKPKELPDGTMKFPVDSWRNDDVRDCIIAACTAKGPWNATEKVRGRGAWLSEDGGLVLHCGETMVLGVANDGQLKREPPGAVDDFVYPTRPPLPRPWPRPVQKEQNPAKLLRPLLDTWSWSRQQVDPHLLMGWIACGFMGAALPWRPIVFMTGDKGSGKSTLQALMKGLYGDWLVQSTNTTAAGIYQRIGNDSLPIAVDEFEGKAESGQAKKLLELARQASSGGLMLRGGDSHKGVEFQARSAFLFSSINTPPLEPQDLSRMALLQLQELRRGGEAPEIDAGALTVIGRCILRRLVDEWPRYKSTLKAFKAELASAGMDGRGQETFGTLLAAADLMEHDGWDEERLRFEFNGDLVPWRDILSPARMIEFEDATPNWLLCLNHLLSEPVEAWRNGIRTTVGQAIQAWYEKTDFDNDIVAVRRAIGQAGLTLQRISRKGDWLAIPNQNPLTRKLFVGTKWAGDQGASVWSGALRQARRGDVYEVGSARVNGVKCKCTLISLEALYGPGGLMAKPPDPDPLVNTACPDPILGEEDP